eukprot:m.37316 g.37316  ORF g.37316 m.37316 type:complete len:120 (+) comp9296_c0_seq2:160-519(+)
MADDKEETEVKTDALGRRIFDKEAIAKKMQQRKAQGDGLVSTVPIRKEDLKRREDEVDLDSNLGKSRLVANQHDKASGFYCKVCDVILRDSMNYLDHINGKKRLFLQGLCTFLSCVVLC